MNRENMLNQVLILREIGDTVGALDLMQRVVVHGELVPLQLVETFELLRALVTLVRLVTMLYLHVLIQGGIGRECRRAATAGNLE